MGSGGRAGKSVFFSFCDSFKYLVVQAAEREGQVFYPSAPVFLTDALFFKQCVEPLARRSQDVVKHLRLHGLEHILHAEQGFKFSCCKPQARQFERFTFVESVTVALVFPVVFQGSAKNVYEKFPDPMEGGPRAVEFVENNAEWNRIFSFG